MDPQTNVAELLTALKAATQIADPRMSEALQKSTFSQSGSATTGLTFYDLESGAKFLYPVLTPLRNMIARVSGRGGIQANWKAVTGVNVNSLSLGVSGGNRGAVQAVSTADFSASYHGLGIESNVDFEAQYAAQNLIDVRAVAGRTGLEAMMLGEEKIILGGNNSIALGTGGTPSVAVVTTGGSFSATQYVKVVPLTLNGVMTATVAGGVQGQVTRTNADGSTDNINTGNGAVSAGATATVSSGSTNSVTASCAAKRGAVGYAWFWGPTSGSEVLGAITTGPFITITAAATGTQLASAAAVGTDYSQDSLVFDGLLTQAFKSGSNAYWADLGGATLTADGDAGIVEIDAALKDRWDNYRLSPDTMWVNSQQALDIGRKILAGNANGAFRINVDMQQGMIAGGIMVSAYLNRFSMDGAKTIAIKIHPNMPAGVILMTTRSLPYPLSNVGNIMQIVTRQEYYQIEWPLRSRRYEYGVYADEVLQHYAPFSMCLITGIKAG